MPTKTLFFDQSYSFLISECHTGIFTIHRCK